MKSLNIIYVFFISLLACCFCACKKIVDIDTPKNQLTASAVFADSTNANAAVLGIYESMMQVGSFGFCSGGMTLYPGLSADELTLSTSDINISPFYNYQVLPNNSINESLWIYAYKYIYQANACIEGIAGAQNISDSFRNSLTAEARFLRAFYYFNLVNLYGPVPLVTSTNYDQTRLTGRSSTDLVYSQIVADLQFAQANLPTNEIDKARGNYYSATALLAKVYLYTGQYAKAVTEADKVINSGQFAMVTDLNSVFLSASTETIWYLLPVVPSHATYEGYYFVPTSTTVIPKYVIINALYNSFEPGDLRKIDWIKSNTIAGQDYPYPYKYKQGSTTNPAEYSVVFRLAELYLIRAEAKANNGDLAGSTADINVIRNRAGLPNTFASDRPSLLLAIEKERQAEMFTEWGNRWFDLKRTNRASTVLSVEKSNWNNNAVLYPIPITEINSNPNLTQNQGY